MVGKRAKASPLAPTGADLATARTWLADAKKPVMVVGLDVLKDEAIAQVNAFAEKHNVPVVTTYKAKGVLPEDHPLALGGAGLSPKADKLLMPFIADADLLLSVGYDPIEMRTGWQNPWDPETQRVIDIHAEPNHHFMHQTTLSFIADTGATLSALSDGTQPQDTWSGGEITALKDALSSAFPSDDEWGPAGVIAECRDALPANTIATCDSGAQPWAARSHLRWVQNWQRPTRLWSASQVMPDF